MAIGGKWRGGQGAAPRGPEVEDGGSQHPTFGGSRGRRLGVEARLIPANGRESRPIDYRTTAPFRVTMRVAPGGPEPIIGLGASDDCSAATRADTPGWKRSCQSDC